MSFTLDQTRKSTLRLYDAINHDQVLQLRSDLAASSITSAHPLTLNAQQVNFVNSSGQQVSDVVTNIKTIETNLVSETARATAAEVVNSQAISAEQLRATTAEGNLTTALNSEITNRTAAVLAEQTRAQAAEATLDQARQALSDATNVRFAANETVLADHTSKTQNIAYHDPSFTQFTGQVVADSLWPREIYTRDTNQLLIKRGSDTVIEIDGTGVETNDVRFYGDVNVNENVSAQSIILNNTTPIVDGGSGSVITTAERTQIGTNTSDIAAEVARATAAEAAEASARQTAINDESAARFLADSTEAAARLAADNALQTSIDVEKGRIDAILAGSSVNLDTLVELVNAYNSADTSLQDQITALQASVSTLQSEKTLIQAQLDELLANSGG